MLNLGSTEESIVVLIELIIWDAVLIWLTDGVSSTVDCVVAALNWHIYLLTLLPSKGNISALKLAMVTNEVAESRKHMLCNGIQYNTPHFQITPEI